jgi:pimeloyl-ACP methyl ester carboxylesterase
MTLPDDRDLAWLESGKPRGFPVFMFHGTPGTRLQVSFDQKAITASGVRFVAPDRPGYGHSTFHRGRTLADWASDVATLADHLGIGRFAVAGVSGGGPHALACARHLGDRVSGVGIVSGIGPVAEPEFGASMEGLNKGTTMVAARAPLALHAFFSLQEHFMRRWPEAALRALSKTMPEADIEILDRPEVQATFRADLRQHSAPAAAQDMTIFARDWGFKLEDIGVPVDVWHGTADKNVPFAHGKAVAGRIPRSRFHECPGEGHLLVVAHLGEILRTITATD